MIPCVDGLAQSKRLLDSAAHLLVYVVLIHSALVAELGLAVWHDLLYLIVLLHHFIVVFQFRVVLFVVPNVWIIVQISRNNYFDTLLVMGVVNLTRSIDGLVSI